MPTSPADPLSTLRSVNHRIERALDHFRPEQTSCSAIPPGAFSALLADLLAAGECLRSLPAAQSSDASGIRQHDALEQQKRAYQANLEKLKYALPGLHAQLLHEKARLQHSLTHAAAASAWANASKKTL